MPPRLLKTREDLGYFAAPDEVHADTAAYLGSQMGLAIPPVSSDEEPRTKTLYRYQAAVVAGVEFPPNCGPRICPTQFHRAA